MGDRRVPFHRILGSHIEALGSVARGSHCLLAWKKGVFESPLLPTEFFGGILTSGPYYSTRDTRTAGDSVIKLALTSNTAWVSQARWSDTNEHMLTSASHDGKVKFWDIRSKIPLHAAKAHDDKALCVCWLGDTTAVSGGADSKVRILRTGN